MPPSPSQEPARGDVRFGDVDEWIRSLTEAQEVTAIPEDRDTYEPQEVDQKSPGHPDGRVRLATAFGAQ